MSKCRFFIAVLAAVILSLLPTASLAQLVPPCTVMGTAYLDDNPVSEGTVAVLIDEEEVAQTTIEADGSFYVQVRGNYADEEMSFKVEGVLAQEIATWKSGKTWETDLHATTPLDEEVGPVGLSLNPDEGVAMLIKGEGFTPGATVEITWNGKSLDTAPEVVKAEKDGTFEAMAVAPNQQAGAYTIKATDTTDPARSVEASFTVPDLTGPPGIQDVEVNTLGPEAKSTAEYKSETETLTLGIPKGEKGDKGDKGDQGPKGDKGPQGTGAPGGAALPIAAIVISIIAIVLTSVFRARRE